MSTRSLIFLCITMRYTLWGSLPCAQRPPGTLPSWGGQEKPLREVASFVRGEAAAATEMGWEKSSG